MERKKSEFVSNYEIAKQKTQKEFLKYDQEEMIQKWNLEADPNFIYMNFVGSDYRLDRNTGNVQGTNNQFLDTWEADYEETLTLYDLLCYAKKDAALSGAYVPMQNLSAVRNASSYAGEGFFKAQEDFLDHREVQLARACEALHGVREGKGDVSYRIPVFDKLSVILQFWNSDEEFPASLQIYCDSNIVAYMHFETLWYLASHVLGRIKIIVNNQDNIL